MNTLSSSRWILFFLFISGSFLSGCSGIKPWEKGRFGDYDMRSDRDPIAASMADHVYFTREAAFGGSGAGGGGCGCN